MKTTLKKETHPNKNKKNELMLKFLFLFNLKFNFNILGPTGLEPMTYCL